MKVPIRGFGLAVPPHEMTQEAATKLAHQVICRSDQQRKLLSILYRKAGVNERHTVLPHDIALNWLPESPADAPDDRPMTLGPTTAERLRYFAVHAQPLACDAACRALDDARIGAHEVTHVVTVSCTGFDAPGVDTALLTELALKPTTQRLQIGFMGCHGAINGLRAAQGLAAANPKASVLLVAVELCSLHYRFQWDPERLVANALFADGAAAVVLGGSDALENSWSLRATGSCLIPNSQEAMSWRIGDHGFEMTLDARVPELIQQHLRPWLEEWLATHGQTLDSIGTWAIHPGGPRILASIEETLGLAHDATAVSREILSQNGNMSSPTVLFILQRLRELGSPLPCVALGFGPGMFAEAALFE